ncbi:MAG: replicative DNA helicase, partial [Rhizobiales bacterium]|nr:replicative DNA helicase [Hyphomicrobiales bacterium]
MTGTDLIEREPSVAKLPAGFRSQPHNIEAEQALLGAILINNEAYHRVSDYLRAEHFYEPVHRRIYEAMSRLIETGRL